MSAVTTRLLLFSKQFERFYERQFSPLLRRWDLTMREVHVLLFLANNPGYDTARDVAEYRGLAKSQVSQAVDLLAAQGLLCRTPDSGDRRVLALSRRSGDRELICLFNFSSQFVQAGVDREGGGTELMYGTRYEEIRSIQLWPNGFAWLLRDGGDAKSAG